MSLSEKEKYEKAQRSINMANTVTKWACYAQIILSLVLIAVVIYVYVIKGAPSPFSR